MKSLEESVVTAMDGSKKELFTFLPYILQDLWEIGSDPEVIIELVERHAHNHSSLSVLDLGCGKGAVCIKMAKVYHCTCLGIDGLPEFIAEAQNKAKEFGVDHLCQFQAGDIREDVNKLPLFDVIILGSIGPVFGDYYTTLTTISKCLTPEGLIIIDDGYIADDSDFTPPMIQKRGTILQQIKDVGMQLVDEVIIGKDDIATSDAYIFENLKKRCQELVHKHPEKRMLFENYLREQEEENEVLETKVICSTMVIRKKQKRFI